MWRVVARCSAKPPSWKFHKTVREIPELESSFWRSSCPDVFCKEEVLENFAKLKGKHLCQSLFLNKVACFRPATLLKKRLWHRCFLVNFAKFPSTFSPTEHLPWLHLLLLPQACNFYERETPALVFQNHPFVDPLQNRCSWIIHKIYRKTPVLKSLFK